MDKQILMMWHIGALISGTVMLTAGILGFLKVNVPHIYLTPFYFYGGVYLVILGVLRLRGKK